MSSWHTAAIAQDATNFIRAEIVGGFTAASNKFFPDRSLQKQLTFSYLQDTHTSNDEWVYWLKAPRTGVSVGITDFGNSRELGYAFTALPFLEFQSFKNPRWHTQLGIGASYFTQKFDFNTNFDNRAVSTDVTWTARIFLHYTFLERPKMQYRVGAGLFHHSNGHTRLPNQGYNSFLISISADVKSPTEKIERSNLKKPERTLSNYFTLRGGIGQNVLGDGFPFSNKKEVYTLSAEYGKTFNKTLKIGVGAFYRVYEHYYDYISNNEFLVRDGEEFASFKNDPWSNASNIALYTKGELLLNHVGFEVLLGVNLHKPAYKIDWRLNEGWDFIPREPPPSWIYGEFNSKFRLKELFTARLGLKYYAIATESNPKHNVYLGAFISANLGQADFTELGIGYVYQWGLKNRS